MNCRTRIDKIVRRLPAGEIDVVFVISNEGATPAAAQIRGETYAREESESLPDFADRALIQYRSQHKPIDNVSVLVMDCRL